MVLQQPNFCEWNINNFTRIYNNFSCICTNEFTIEWLRIGQHALSCMFVSPKFNGSS
jgi:hypothetical protein